MAPAGLWSTPSDLLVFAMEIQNALGGKGKILSAETAREMLKLVKESAALGVFVVGKVLRAAVPS
jgi:hypothetical protein